MEYINLAGEWICDGHPQGLPFSGQMRIVFRQDGVKLTGMLEQITSPYTGKADAGLDKMNAHVLGELFPSQSGCHLVVWRRINIQGPFRAMFAGVVGDNGRRIEGAFVNSDGHRGTFEMVKDENLILEDA